jgi:hypothetical protein
LRSRLISWVARQHGRGQSLSAIAAELSLPKQTVARWSMAAKMSTALVPVRVVAQAAEPGPRMVRVVSPSGFVVDGLSMQEAATLLRLLG